MHHNQPRSTDLRCEAAAETVLRRRHRLIGRALTTLVVALSPAAMQACGRTEHNRATPGPDEEAGRRDALSATNAGGGPVDGGSHKDCTPILTMGDAGPDGDGDPSCTITMPCGLNDPSLRVVGCDMYHGNAKKSYGCRLVDENGCKAGAYAPGPGGGVQIFCADCAGGAGRRPAGLVKRGDIRAPTPIGAYFARMAYEEAASVHAFRRMRDELAFHGAPDPLVRAAERSMQDEVRHTRVMARYARAHGAPVLEPCVRRSAPRSLEAIARENAAEGCIREMFGALLLRWQAAHAPDTRLRRKFARIAADETRHTALAWTVAWWAEERLDTGANARIRAVRARAIRSLSGSACAAPLLFEAHVGLPNNAARNGLRDGMIAALRLA